MGGKSGGGMPQQQTPPSPGVGTSGVGKSGGGKMGGGTPQMQPGAAGAKPPPNQDMLMQQRMQMMQQRGRPGQGFQPYAPPPIGASTPSIDPTIANNPAMSAATPATPAAGTPPANQYQQNEQQKLDQQRMQQSMDALRQGGIGGLASYAGRGGGKYGGGMPQDQMRQARSYSDPLRAQSGMQQAQGLSSLLGFAEGGPVTQAPIAWTPTGANISPGTPSGPVVWNPNMFGGAPATGGTGVMTGLKPLGPIVNTPAPTVGVVKYVAPPPVVKPVEKKAEVKKPDVLRWAEGWGGEGGFNGGRGRGNHAGFSGTQGAHGFSGRGGGGPGNVGGGLYSLGGIIR